MSGFNIIPGVLRKGVLSLNKSSSCSIRKKITALLLSLCLAAAFVPTVGAASDTGETQSVDSAEFIVPVDESATQTVAPDTTTQATESTTQATENHTGDRRNNRLHKILFSGFFRQQYGKL